MFKHLLLYPLQALAVGVLLLISKALGVERASALGAFIGRSIGPRTPLHRRARERMAKHLPTLSATAREEALQEMWGNLGRTLLEYAHLKKLAQAPYLKVTGTEHFAQLNPGLQGAVIVGGHFANWEILPAAFAQRGAPLHVLVRPPSNLFIALLVGWLRRPFSKSMVPRNDAQVARALVGIVRRKEWLGLLVDQRVSSGPRLLFLNEPVATGTLPAALAVKQGYSVIPIHIQRQNGPHFLLQVHPPLKVPAEGGEDSRIQSLTTQINNFLGEQILAHPGQWLWLHNRWK